MNRPRGFREYFLEQADLADDVYARGFRINCHMGATAALDSLASIWASDFPDDATALAREFGGTVPAAARLSRFVRRFTGDPRAARVAVIRFCEDARPHAKGQGLTEIEALLAQRKPRMPGELPSEREDMTLEDLVAKAPGLFEKVEVRALAEEYHYPGLLYTLYRCPTVHSLSYPKQAQGFAVNEEVMYMQLHPGFTSIGFGHKLATNWLRAAVNGYVEHCASAGIEPASRIDPGAEQEARLAGKWKRVLANTR